MESRNSETKPNAAVFPDSPESRYFGLRKRELFAALALTGILAKHGADDDQMMAKFADDAVRGADALIEALNREEE